MTTTMATIVSEMMTTFHVLWPSLLVVPENVGVGVEGCEDVVSLCLNGSSRGILVVLVPSLSLNPENVAVGVEDGVSGVGVEDGEALGLGGSLGKQGG